MKTKNKLQNTHTSLHLQASTTFLFYFLNIERIVIRRLFLYRLQYARIPEVVMQATPRAH